jgi:hypothetical protein
VCERRVQLHCTDDTSGVRRESSVSIGGGGLERGWDSRDSRGTKRTSVERRTRDRRVRRSAAEHLCLLPTPVCASCVSQSSIVQAGPEAAAASSNQI